MFSKQQHDNLCVKLNVVFCLTEKIIFMFVSICFNVASHVSFTLVQMHTDELRKGLTSVVDPLQFHTP